METRLGWKELNSTTLVSVFDLLASGNVSDQSDINPNTLVLILGQCLLIYRPDSPRGLPRRCFHISHNP